MALADTRLSESISSLTETIESVAKTTLHCKPELAQLRQTLQRISAVIIDVVKLNQQLDRSNQELDMLIEVLQHGEQLVRKGLNIKWNFYKRFVHTLNLKVLNQELLRIFQIVVQAYQSRDIKQTLLEAGVKQLHHDDTRLSESISSLTEIIESVAKTTVNCKPQLAELRQTLQRISPIINDVVKLNQQLDRSNQELDMFIEVLQHGQQLVRRGSNIKWNFFKRFTHILKLKDLNQELLRIFQIVVEVYQSRDIKQTLLMVNDVNRRINQPTVDVKQLHHDGTSLGYELTEGEKLSWRVPVLPGGVVGFDEPLKKLKAKVLDDDFNGEGESRVLVVAAAGGCGKTALVTMLCHDSEIQAKYRENIFYVTVQERPNFMVLVNNLLNPNHLSGAAMVQSDEDAKDELEKFFREQLSGPILLVLDGVQSDLFIKKFEFNIREYKILVTSKMIFPKYDVFQLDPLSDKDAKDLFVHSAFNDHETIPSPIVDDDLVDQMVKCCKKHPLTLSVVGSSLKGKYKFVWKSVMKTLSQGDWVLYNKYETKRVQRIIVQLDEEFEKCLLEFETLDEEFKQCLLDLGLFPSDHRIPACALLDMWTNLYGHDDMGEETLIKIFQLSYRNLVNSITIGEEANAIVNYCDQTFVTQQDLQRELAIHFCGKEPISQRTRLIIDAQGNDLPASIRQVKEVMSARILSISTGESFSSSWCNINAPDVEVVVLNIMSHTYTLPHFLESMQKLKILNITNYGLHETEFVNFHLLGSLTTLTRIRLERVVLSLTSASILDLLNLQKLSLIMCKIGNSFERLNTDNANIWPRLVEIEIDSCQDLVGFPELFCNSVHLEKLSITNCNELVQLPQEIGKLTSLRTLSLRSCTKLEKMPDSISRLEKLTILDISDCFSLSKLPENIGMLGGLQLIYMKGCTGIHELPPSVTDLSQLQVFCSEEISYKWREFPNVKLPVVEDDRLLILTKNISDWYF